VRADYSFSGWYDGTTKYTKYTEITKDVTLTAQWDALYTITFDIGYTDAASPEPVILKPGQSAGILFPPDPVRADWIFKGWFDAANNKYDLNTVITQSVTLTADWFQGRQVTFEVFGGMAANPEPLAIEQNTAMGSQLPIPTLPDKFTFDGWYDASGTKYDSDTAITADVTLTGKWTKAADVHRITARNAGNPVFKFTVPAGDQFGNYTKITARFLVNDENKSTATPAFRVYGSYKASDFSDTGTRYWKGPPGSYLQFNNQFIPAGNVIPVKYQWYTLEVPFDSPKQSQTDFDARFPKANETGDFYFALALSLGGGSSSAVPVTSYMTEITLSNADGSKKIVSPGSGFAKPAMIGTANGDVNDEGTNTGDISRQ
jgi:uncharacterized repeat protein (TIGR02543 family)